MCVCGCFIREIINTRVRRFDYTDSRRIDTSRIRYILDNAPCVFTDVDTYTRRTDVSGESRGVAANENHENTTRNRCRPITVINNI